MGIGGIDPLILKNMAQNSGVLVDLHPSCLNRKESYLMPIE